MTMKRREMTALSTKEQSILPVEMPFFSYRLQNSLKIVWKKFRCSELYSDTARRCSIINTYLEEKLGLRSRI